MNQNCIDGYYGSKFQIMKSLFSVLTLTIMGLSCYAQVNSPQSNSEKNSSVAPLEDASVQPAAQMTLKNFISTRNNYVNKNDKTISRDSQQKLDAIVESLEEENVNSYEYNYAKYLNENRSISAFKYLQKASEIYPNNELLNKDFIHHYELTNDIAKRNAYCKKLYETNTLEEGLIEYNYNVLMSVPKNGILFTYGSDDTYPLFVLQAIKKVRTDVLVLSIDMLSEETYRKNKSTFYGLKIQWVDNVVSTAEWIIKNNTSKTICLGHTVSPKLLQTFKSNLYLTGLTYQYATNPIENIPVLVKNYETFKLDQLKKTANYSNLAKLNGNYILPLITLMENYKNTGKTDEATQLRTLILKVAKQQGTEFENKISAYLTSINL